MPIESPGCCDSEWQLLYKILASLPSVSAGSAYTGGTGITIDSSHVISSNLSTGIAGGQSVVGGTASGNNLTVSSTSNATKGKILFGTSAYDEVNNRLGVGTTAPAAVLNSFGTTEQLRLSSGVGATQFASFFVDASGILNIGTVGSSASLFILPDQLQVSSGASASILSRATGAGGTAFVYTQNNGTDTAGIQIEGGGTANLPGIGVFNATKSLVIMPSSNVASGGTDSIRFYVGGSASTQERGRWTTTGLGIGKTNPATVFQVVSASAPIIRLGTGTGFDTDFSVDPTNGNLSITTANGLITFNSSLLMASTTQIALGSANGTGRLNLPTSTAGTSQMNFQMGGTTPSTPSNGDLWADTRLMFRQNALSAEVVTASAVNSVSPTSPNRTISVSIGGTTFFIAAKTTND